MRQFSTLLAATLLAAAPAVAAADLEKEMTAATGKAVSKMIFGTQEEARAECEAGRAQLSTRTPKYLAAYIEACVALTVSPFGPGKKPDSCPYYQRAVDIWRDSPPPKSSDDVALSRARKLKQWKDAIAESCPTAAAAKAKPTPIVVPEGATVETLEGISYVMPGGWTVENFDETGGHANFENDTLKYGLLVERKAANDKGDYTEKEPLSSGRTFEWEHKEFIKGSGFYVFYARVKFDDAIVNIGMSSSDKADNDGVDKTTALDIARKLAESIKVLGPRRCIADCGPGEITP
jgi:hypothetical protein